MDSLFKQFCDFLTGKYGSKVAMYLEEYYEGKGLQSLEQRFDHVVNDLGFNVSDELTKQSFVQVAEICGVLLPRFPDLFQITIIDPGLN